MISHHMLFLFPSFSRLSLYKWPYVVLKVPKLGCPSTLGDGQVEDLAKVVESLGGPLAFKKPGGVCAALKRDIHMVDIPNTIGIEQS